MTNSKITLPYVKYNEFNKLISSDDEDNDETKIIDSSITRWSF
jgi:hypothetical protein